MYQLRPMHIQDVEAIMALQALCYDALLLESEASVRERLALAANECWVATDDQGVCAYLFAYRSALGVITALDAVFKPLTDGTCYYIHDLAVHPRVSGQGVGQSLAKHALEHAKTKGFESSALVSVQNSGAFWQRLGFLPYTVEDALQAAHLASYHIEATYMVNPLLPKTS